MKRSTTWKILQYIRHYWFLTALSLFFAAVTMLVLPDAVCNLIGIALGAAMAAWCFSRARGRRRGMST